MFAIHVSTSLRNYIFTEALFLILLFTTVINNRSYYSRSVELLKLIIQSRSARDKKEIYLTSIHLYKRPTVITFRLIITKSILHPRRWTRISLIKIRVISRLLVLVVYICQINNTPVSNMLGQTHSVYLPPEEGLGACLRIHLSFLVIAVINCYPTV